MWARKTAGNLALSFQSAVSMTRQPTVTVSPVHPRVGRARPSVEASISRQKRLRHSLDTTHPRRPRKPLHCPRRELPLTSAWKSGGIRMSIRTPFAACSCTILTTSMMMEAASGRCIAVVSSVASRLPVGGELRQPGGAVATASRLCAAAVVAVAAVWARHVEEQARVSSRVVRARAHAEGESAARLVLTLAAHMDVVALVGHLIFAGESLGRRRRRPLLLILAHI